MAANLGEQNANDHIIKTKTKTKKHFKDNNNNN